MPNMLTLDVLTQKNYSAKQWLQYYRNVWLRNTIARTIDVNTDQKLKKDDPKAMVIDAETGRPIPVAERLENRKIAVQDGLDIIEGIDRLLEACQDSSEAGEFEKKHWSKEALKVDDDMIQKEPKAGDACKMPDGKDGVLQDKDGKLVCTLPAENGAAPEAGAKV